MRCERCGNKDHDVRAKACRVCGSLLAVVERTHSARSSSNYRDVSNWRRHILQRHGAPPVELKDGDSFVLGRSSKSDLKISSPKISRRHTEVFWRDGAPVVRDLGSENGTEVNGKPIKEHVLEDEDEITIGPFSCIYRCLQGTSSIQVAKELSDSQADTQAMFAVAMTGKLEDMSVYELLETLSYNQKTGTLDLYSASGAEGSVALQEGLPLSATAGNLQGEKAVYHILGWGEGQYRFVAGLEAGLSPNVWTTMQQLLLHAQELAKSTDRHRRQATGRREQQPTGKHRRQATGRHDQQPTEKHRRRPTGRREQQPTGKHRRQATGRHGRPTSPDAAPAPRETPPPQVKRPGSRRPPPSPPSGRRPKS